MEVDDSKSTVARRIKILAKLNKNGKVYVKDLSQSLGVSEVTIRNDMIQLEKKNMLLRARGGAIKIDQHQNSPDFPISDKQKKQLQEKIAIGKKAAELIENDNTIILDSGTTTYELAKNFGKFESLTVITNALNVATLLAEHKNVNVIMPGGTLKTNSLSLVGFLAERGFKDFYCDKLFLGVDGFDTTHGISTPNLEEAHLNKIMIDISREVIVVADSSKFKKRGFALIAPINKINTVITDKNIPQSDLENLENLGVKVIIA